MIQLNGWPERELPANFAHDRWQRGSNQVRAVLLGFSLGADLLRRAGVSINGGFELADRPAVRTKYGHSDRTAGQMEPDQACDRASRSRLAWQCRSRTGEMRPRISTPAKAIRRRRARYQG